MSADQCLPWRLARGVCRLRFLTNRLLVVALCLATLAPAASVRSAGTESAPADATVAMRAPGADFTGTVAAPERVDFALVGSMAESRNEAHTATLLPGGRLLVAGGWMGVGAVATAELYDPVSFSWSATGRMSVARDNHTTTLLNTGKVLVAGGSGSGGYLASAELYDPATGSWASTGSLEIGRHFHTATLLNSGKVLVAGGAGNPGHLASAELYDPATGIWSPTGSMSTGRYLHTATLLTSGKVLVVGGIAGSFFPEPELYDPATGAWTSAGSLSELRSGHTATLLGNGKVLLAGGHDLGFAIDSSAKLYDPATGAWAATGSLTTARTRHTATRLDNGQVLVVGGADNLSNAVSSAELYDAATGLWTGTGGLNLARSAHTATRLSDGKVLIVGGSGPQFPQTTAELGSLLPANTFTATLTLPPDWSTNPIPVRMIGSTTGAALDAFALSNDGTTWGPWLLASDDTPLDVTWDVGSTGGNRTVHLRAHDVDGQYAEVIAGTMYDTGPPVGTVAINGGALTTTGPTVSLTLAAGDALTSVADMVFSNDEVTWSAWLPYAASAPWTLSSGDGLKTVYVRFRDLAGNVSATATAQIVLDTSTGANSGVSIDSGAPFTNTSIVTLTLIAPAGTTEMKVSNEGGFAGSDWGPYALHLSWPLIQTGPYTDPRIVYAKFRNGTNETRRYQDDIILDVTPPIGSIAIVGFTAAPARVAAPAATTPVARVYLPIATRPTYAQLSLSATDDVSGVGWMQIGDDSGFAGAAWEAYSASKAWPLPMLSEPTYLVYARFRDNAGNVSAVYSASGTR